MDTFYWTIDFYDSDNNLIKAGDIRYASEFQASTKARDMHEVPCEITIRVQKHKFNF
jgi:hypothetical protein